LLKLTRDWVSVPNTNPGSSVREPKRRIENLANSASLIGCAAALCKPQNSDELNAVPKRNRDHVSHANGTTGRVDALAVDSNMPGCRQGCRT
jgi:hypothetical protein